jgi:ParB-like chromosome segregation protein Spo0J
MRTSHDLTVHDLTVTDLTHYPGNPRVGDIELLKRSLSAHGQYAPIAVQKSTNFVIKGNNTLRAAVELGWSTIAGTILDVDDDQAKRIVLLDNAASERGDFVGEDLAAILDSLGGDLSDTGYDDGALDGLLARLDGDLPEVEYVKLDLLHPHPRNYREHPDDQTARIMESIRTQGFYRPIVTARDFTILAGHGITLAAQRLEVQTVPVIKLDLDPNEPKALNVLVSDNELANMAEGNDRELVAILRDLLADDDLSATGFDEQQLAAFEFLTAPPARDATEEWLGMPEWQSQNRPPEVRLYFDSEEDRTALIDLLKLDHITTRGHGVMIARWPDRPNKKRLDVSFEETGLLAFPSVEGDGSGHVLPDFDPAVEREDATGVPMVEVEG